MGTRKRLTREAVTAGFVLPFALRETLPCTLCEVPIPVAALRNGHGLMAWCGTVVVTCEYHGVHARLCPQCARKLNSELGECNERVPFVAR